MIIQLKKNKKRNLIRLTKSEITMIEKLIEIEIESKVGKEWREWNKLYSKLNDMYNEHF